MAVRTLPPVEYLRECFRYNAETGDICHRLDRPLTHFASPLEQQRWVNRRRNRVLATTESRGYLLVSVGALVLRAHRVAWAMHFGTEPPKMLDHINGNGMDNRISNLRAATPAQNQSNRCVRRDSSIGLKGVVLHRSTGKYRARLWIDGKFRSLGLHDTPEAAHAAYLAEAKREHGEYARSG
jgi:hypothetical protein